MKQKRKDKSYQTSMFDKDGRPLLDGQNSETGKATNRVDYISALEEQRHSTGDLLTKILDYDNVNKAIKQVKSNKGSCGVDGKSIEESISWFGEHYTKLKEQILESKYQVSEVRKVEIEKEGGGKRILGIPTIQDRIIQQAIHQELSKLYDKHFSEHSYGFRKGKSAHMAIEQASEYVREGYEWVVDIDLEKYFESIPQDRLMQRLSKGIGDKVLLKLIRKYLEAGLMDIEGITEQRISGSPQGGPLSPLLSNIVLDELDKELEQRGHRFCRYADDCNIYVKSEKAGERVMSSVVDYIERKLKLKVNRQKSGVRRCSEVKFLGYTILEGGGIKVSNKSIERLKKKVIKITKRNRGVKFEAIIKELNKLIVGYGNYYSLANRWLAGIRDIDGWIRRRLRCYRLKQCKRTIGLVRFLRTLGVKENYCWNAAYWRSEGWWRKTIYLPISQAMGKSYFEENGLRSLLTTMTGKTS